MDLVLPDHLGERDAQFRRAHRAGDGHEHDAAGVYMLDVGVGGVFQGCGVEMQEVTVDEIRNRASRCGHRAKTITKYACALTKNLARDRRRILRPGRRLPELDMAAREVLVVLLAGVLDDLG